MRLSFWKVGRYGSAIVISSVIHVILLLLLKSAEACRGVKGVCSDKAQTTPIKATRHQSIENGQKPFKTIALRGSGRRNGTLRMAPARATIKWSFEALRKICHDENVAGLNKMGSIKEAASRKPPMPKYRHQRLYNRKVMWWLAARSMWVARVEDMAVVAWAEAWWRRLWNDSPVTQTSSMVSGKIIFFGNNNSSEGIVVKWPGSGSMVGR